jgi:hypothetical protein
MEMQREAERPTAPRLAVGAFLLASVQALIAIAVAVVVVLGATRGGSWLWLVLGAAELACAAGLLIGGLALRRGRDSLLVVAGAAAVTLGLIWAALIWLNSGTSGIFGLPDLGTAPALIAVAVLFLAIPVTVLALVHAPSVSVMVDTVGPRRVSRFGKRETRAAVLFISPWIVGFLVFTLGPMVWSLYLSFTKYVKPSDNKALDQAIGVFYDSLDYAKMIPPSPAGQQIQQAYQQAVTDALGGKDPKAALDAAQQTAMTAYQDATG